MRLPTITQGTIDLALGDELIPTIYDLAWQVGSSFAVREFEKFLKDRLLMN